MNETYHVVTVAIEDLTRDQCVSEAFNVLADKVRWWGGRGLFPLGAPQFVKLGNGTTHHVFQALAAVPGSAAYLEGGEKTAATAPHVQAPALTQPAAAPASVEPQPKPLTPAQAAAQAANA
ncbi:hypothetical protein E3E12_01585 [Formicincola oecophyllae]|uniref:Uncharacterized protein n=1 Tax=Formicincola oecophyllae TaxID=2558361 RepID=A0A4Y6U6V8_9PROT|nr:hypothetical protein [Formicincola oecophyllae]QDH13103.1 hypothetical protein E3E12_01585 [Formicincola oecophyllae]